MSAKVVDITGKRFGRLVAQKAVGKKGKKIVWECLCDCGTTRNVIGTNLRGGTTNSCGCYMKDRLKETNTRHGHAKGYKVSREYHSYMSMIQRCTNPNHPAFKNYGGRGISVCESWLGGFDNFISDMGHRPIGTELDRADNNKGYSKDNCRWVSAKENGSNKRNNRLLSLGGETKTLSQWSETQSIPLDTLWHRLQAGWDEEKALTTAVRAHNRKLESAVAQAENNAPPQ